MTRLSEWLEALSTLQVLLLVLGVTLGLSVAAAILGAVLVRFGMRRPAVVSWASRFAERLLHQVKRPLTIVVLDEVAAVVRTGTYTRNISEALQENHDQLKALIAEKVKQDPSVRLIGRLPGYDTVASEVTETTLRVIIEMLDDPRAEDLISDLLRDTINQIKHAVREDAPVVVPPVSPDPVPDPPR